MGEDKGEAVALEVRPGEGTSGLSEQRGVQAAGRIQVEEVEEGKWSSGDKCIGPRDTETHSGVVEPSLIYRLPYEHF